MKKRLVSLLVVAVVLLSFVGSTSAVTWGVPDNGEHPYVGTLLFQQGSSFYSCTGTLLNATTVLTAGHCTEEGGVVNTRTYFMVAEDVLATRDRSTENFEQWLVNDWVAGTPIPHPQYDDFSGFPATYDIGIVKLAAPINVGSYASLPTVGLLDTLRGQDRHANFTVVGYGMQGYINPFESDIWARYKGTASLIEVNSHLNAGLGAKFSNNPGNASGGSCYGDSGGPVFFGNTSTVVAVVSWGNTPCIGVDMQFRTDTQVAQDFIYAHLN